MVSTKQSNHLKTAREFASLQHNLNSTTRKIKHLIQVADEAKTRAILKINDLLEGSVFTIEDFDEFDDDTEYMKGLKLDNSYNIIEYLKIEKEE